MGKDEFARENLYLYGYFQVLKGKFDDLIPWPFLRKVHIRILDTMNNSVLTTDLRPNIENPIRRRWHNANIATITKFLNYVRPDGLDTFVSKSGYLYIKFIAGAIGN